MNSLYLVFYFAGNKNIQKVAQESDYHVTHEYISETEVIDVNEEDLTLTVKCELSLPVDGNMVDKEIVADLDYAFYTDCEQREEYISELISHSRHYS
jgi:hypothetical protein